MVIIDIASAEAGQVLARAVTTPEGVTLCPAGFRLTEGAIQRLKNAGIDSVSIEKSDDRREDVEARLAEMEQRFKHITDPVLLRIRELVERHFRSLLPEDR